MQSTVFVNTENCKLSRITAGLTLTEACEQLDNVKKYRISTTPRGIKCIGIRTEFDVKVFGMFIQGTNPDLGIVEQVLDRRFKVHQFKLEMDKETRQHILSLPWGNRLVRILDKYVSEVE